MVQKKLRKKIRAMRPLAMVRVKKREEEEFHQ